MVLVYAFVGGELALFFWLGTAARGACGPMAAKLAGNFLGKTLKLQAEYGLLFLMIGAVVDGLTTGAQGDHLLRWTMLGFDIGTAAHMLAIWRSPQAMAEQLCQQVAADVSGAVRATLTQHVQARNEQRQAQRAQQQAEQTVQTSGEQPQDKEAETEKDQNAQGEQV
ncbi:unnamed protein product [Symbiodinium natans]|uniref:Uncharacterized protein n=1 Tax=Symbiodinium natans TaxID=878477 RepID=A0A812N3P1_9DINO|nr:unnamed protein product [Symbiodinium natans]